MSKYRESIIALHLKNVRQCDIAKRLDVCRKLVSKTMKRYQELGNIQDRPRSGRPVTAVTHENVNKVRCRIRRSTEHLMRKMASDLGISPRSVRRIVEMKLGLRSYKINRAHFLDDRMKLQRLQKCRKIQRLVAAGRLNRVLFTDEKIFTI